MGGTVTFIVVDMAQLVIILAWLIHAPVTDAHGRPRQPAPADHGSVCLLGLAIGAIALLAVPQHSPLPPPVLAVG